MKRLLRYLIILAVLGGGVWWVSSQQATPPTDSAQDAVQERFTITVKDLRVTISGTGAVTPVRTVNLSFPLSASVNDIFVSINQPVKQGDVLAQLRVTDLQTALDNAQLALQAQQDAYAVLTAPARAVDIEVAQAAVNAALAQAGAASLGADPNTVEIARIQEEMAKNQVWQAQLQRDLQAAQQQQVFDHWNKLGIPEIPGLLENPGNPADNVTATIIQAENSVALADANLSATANQPADAASLGAANAQFVSAQAQLDRLLNGPSAMDLQISQIQIALALAALDQAQAALARARLVAPFDGVITQQNLVVGQYPASNQVAVQMADTSQYFVDVAVDETDIVKMAVGQAVEIKLDALPDAGITGTVTRVAYTPTRVGQLVTYVVRVAVNPSKALIRVGMTATVRVIVNDLKDVLVVPNRFIRIDRNTQQAYAVLERGTGQFEEVAIQLGLRNESESQVLAGLQADDVVVLIPRDAFNPITD